MIIQIKYIRTKSSSSEMEWRALFVSCFVIKKYGVFSYLDCHLKNGIKNTSAKAVLEIYDVH